jgi:hypothetical protein
MTKWSGLGDCTELPRMGLSQRAGADTGGGGRRSGCFGERSAGERAGAAQVALRDTREELRMVGRHKARAGEGVRRRRCP